MTAAHHGNPVVSITIPCYRQLAHAQRAVSSVLAQTFDAFELTLLDDGASDDYRDYVESLDDVRVRYHRNPERLGAMRNMFHAITYGRGVYSMAFHEDDLLSTTYLAAAMEIFERHRSCAFVACQLREFEQDPSATELAAPHAPLAYDIYATGADLVRGIVRGVEPMFGSVVYRRAAVAGVVPDHAGYATLVDRPFLLAIMARGHSGAVIRSPLVWYRRHGEGDTRHLAMTADHVLRLLGTYRDTLPAGWAAEDRDAFFRYSGYWLFELYRLTPPRQRPLVWKYLFRAWRLGLYNPRARGRFGVRQILRALLNRTS